MAADRLIAAGSLDTVTVDATGTASASGGTLAAEASSGGGAALGSGAFGKVGTYCYHGALAAVKELKAGADEETIGAAPKLLSPPSTPGLSPFPRHRTIPLATPQLRLSIQYALFVP